MALKFNPTPEFWFQVVQKPGSVPKSAKYSAYLLEDNWDDWAKFRTQFILTVFDEKGTRHDLGPVKIGQFNLDAGKRDESEPGKRRAPKVPPSFVALSDEFFSLGQSENYYEDLGKNLSSFLRDKIVESLRDVVADTDLWKKALGENVMGASLLRDVRSKTVEIQFRRLLRGGVKLTPFNFSFSLPPADQGRLALSFQSKPASSPPTNIHVLIGQNGVGKTTVLNRMAEAYVHDDSTGRAGVFDFVGDESDKFPFTNLVTVSFSAFDRFERTPGTREYSYIGLRKPGHHAKSFDELSSDFVKRASDCMSAVRRPRLKKALEMLEADSIFKGADAFAALETAHSENVFEETARALFEGLSSGHKIVFLSVVGLVQKVDEKTLVLLDEPEAHLHPPLLSAFLRALCDLLIDRNGIAIIATHSPVVLQEVPNRCVWKLRRSGSLVAAVRPEIETFGENVGVLTRDVFGLEVDASGFHQMLADAVRRTNSYEEALAMFGGSLGSEAQAILQGLFIAKNARRG